jgi:hypothetical protein
MTSPAKHDDIGCKSRGLGQDGVHRRLIDDDHLRIRPTTRENAPRMFGGVLPGMVHGSQQDRSIVLCATVPRDHDAHP